jgi:hypothetical protein
LTSAVRTAPACVAGISNVPDGRCSLFGPIASLREGSCATADRPMARRWKDPSEEAILILATR